MENNLAYIKDSHSILGEGPLYNKKENTLYWTDIKASKLHKYDLESKNLSTYNLFKSISSFAFTNTKKIIATTNDGFEYLDLESLEMESIINPEKDLFENRFNDGKCDAKGRYFAGTMDDNELEIKGSLYCLDGLKVEKKEKDLFVSNGLAWNKDSTKFYLTDSPKRVIYVYDYDLETATMTNKKIFAKIDEKDGYPDGLCIDSQDHIWSAHWEGWKVTRYKPDGSIDKIIDLPVPKVTSCCFGAEDLKTLFITTASVGLSEEELKKAPLSGCTFILETEESGIDSNLYKINTI